MPLEYHITFEITNADDSEMLTSLEWIKDNHGTKIHDADADGETKIITGELIESVFNDAVTTVSALKTQFTTRMGDKWSVKTHFVP